MIKNLISEARHRKTPCVSVGGDKETGLHMDEKTGQTIDDLRKRIASVPETFMTADDEFSFTNMSWHSAIGLDSVFQKSKRFIASIPSDSEYVGKMFRSAGSGGQKKGLLIHKTRKSLWRFSKDSKRIEPVFASDVLSLEDLEEDVAGIQP